MNHVIFILMLLALGASAQASVVQCREKSASSGGQAGCVVKFTAAKPLAVLACVAGAGGFVMFTEGDADLILATEAPIISGEIRGDSWLQIADKIIERTNKAIRDAKVTARVQAETLEYREEPASDGAEAPRRKLFRITGILRRPPPPKERITFFNRKEDQ